MIHRVIKSSDDNSAVERETDILTGIVPNEAIDFSTGEHFVDVRRIGNADTKKEPRGRTYRAKRSKVFPQNGDRAAMSTFSARFLPLSLCLSLSLSFSLFFFFFFFFSPAGHKPTL